jgi:rhodanese-related sulfurtransferase
MTKKDELLQQLRGTIPAITIGEAQQHITENPGQLAFVDVREADEHARGFIPGTVYIPRSFLELRVENVIKNKEQAVVVYCASGVRSLFAAKSLQELGYTRVLSLAGGFNGWQKAGLPVSAK